MRRYTITMAFCMIALFCKAQEGWYIGVQASPFHYWMYNKQDFNKTMFELSSYRPTDVMEPKPIDLFAPNGLGFGFSVGYNFHRYWGLSSGLFYSNQKQEFIFGNRYPELFPTWDFSITENLRYLHLPVAIEGYMPFSNVVKLYGSIGLQYSLLIDSEFIYTYVNESQSVKSSTKVKNKDYYLHYISNSKKTERHSKLAGNPYNRHLFGVLTGVGLQFRLGRNWSLNSAFTGSFDFINTERKKSIQLDEYGRFSIPFEKNYFYYSDFEGSEPSPRFAIGSIKYRRIPQYENGEIVGFEPRAKTHNIRAGFSIELVYYFNP